jgi:hypothetical protein
MGSQDEMMTYSEFRALLGSLSARNAAALVAELVATEILQTHHDPIWTLTFPQKAIPNVHNPTKKTQNLQVWLPETGPSAETNFGHCDEPA